MADFFLSVPGLLATAGVGALILLRSGNTAPRVAAARDERPARLIMQMAISTVILGAGLWVILSGRYSADAGRWASGAIGTVMGYWLKP
jgi:phosphomannomutase